MPPPASSTTRLAHGRSRKGCIYCKSAKVKCDEQKPKCGRCSRLLQDCRMPVPSQSLRERRRGQGPLKSRASWKHMPILPEPTTATASSFSDQANLPRCIDTQAGLGDGFGPFQNIAVPSNRGVGLDVLPSFPMEGPRSIPSLTEPLNGRMPQEHVNTSAAALGPDFGEDLTFCHGWNYFDFYSENPLSDGLLMPHDPVMNLETNSKACSLNDSFAIHQPTLTAPHIEDPSFAFGFSNTMVSTHYERLGLSYYRTTYTLSRTTRPFSWSHYELFLQIAHEQPMIMHLILAGSLRQLAVDTNADQEPYNLAKRHYNKGSYMLKQSLGEGFKSDHLTIIISFWLLYLAILDRGNILDKKDRQQLTSELHNYVTRHQLDRMCVEALLEKAPCDDASGDGSAKKVSSLLAKVLLWLFYLDIIFSFNNTGGFLADALMVQEGRLSQLFDISQLALEVNWGPKYPTIEVMSSIESLGLDQLNHEIHILHHRLNRVFWPGVEDVESIRRSIDALEAKHNSIFRIAGSSADHPTRSLQRIKIKACEFYALRIYCFRSSAVEVQRPTPSNILTAVTRFLAIIHRIWESERRPCYFDRELFLVGLETEDRIYRDWITDRIGQGQLKNALTRVWQDQDLHHRRLSMCDLRRMLFVDPMNNL